MLKYESVSFYFNLCILLLYYKLTTQGMLPIAYTIQNDPPSEFYLLCLNSKLKYLCLAHRKQAYL